MVVFLLQFNVSAMNLQQRIDLFAALGNYLRQSPDSWLEARRRAGAVNPWFTESFVQLALDNIIEQYLEPTKLNAWAEAAQVADQHQPKTVGIVMAGNIPMVGFHDLLAVFIAGHRQRIKLSSKDEVLMTYLVETLHSMQPETTDWIRIQDMLKDCDAYIATGSDQSARYFEYYFSRFPHIIRPNKTSVAVLTGEESAADLERLADDVHLYFGLGCRNVTKVYVPAGYDFIPMLDAFKRYSYLRELHRYTNNFDYQLSIILLNKQYYMSNDTILLVEAESIHSPIGVLFYEYYSDAAALREKLQQTESIQCIVGNGYTSFGKAQQPSLSDYADGVDTLAFLRTV
ncbi:MAG TPA: acyl-CoA reductase [Ferruginibacter sp.]|nr:acyl-CoA reductase [Ferruginibacter sp.]